MTDRPPLSATDAFCAVCRDRLQADDEFCGVCGAHVNPCVHCGHALVAGNERCPSCDSFVDRGAITSPPADVLDTALSSLWSGVLDRLRAATLGEFQVVRELGRGGMAAVFLAHDIHLDRKVAIKVMSPALAMDNGMVERFRKEARTGAGLKHPNIAAVHRVLDSDGLHFFVMDFVRGRSLEAILLSFAPLSIAVTRAVLYQVGSALSYGHRRKIYHRDVKPGNILVSSIDGTAIVTDFGIAKVAESPGQTQTGAVIGTPAYMAPEQITAAEITGAADQYALGIMAFEMLTGSTPFVGSAYSIMHAHMELPPPPVRSRCSECSEQFEAALLRMLAKRPENRWPSLSDALHALGAMALPEDDPTRAQLALLARPTPHELARQTTRTPMSPVPTSRAVSNRRPTQSPVVSSPDTRNDVADDLRLQAELKAEVERLARVEAERLAKAEAERLAKAEVERLAKAEVERLAKAEAQRLAKVETERLAKAEAERVATAEADRLAKAEAERLANVEAERLAKAEKRRRADEERQAKRDREVEAKREAERRKEADRQAKANQKATAKREAEALRAPGEQGQSRFLESVRPRDVVVLVAVIALVVASIWKLRKPDHPVDAANSAIASPPPATTQLSLGDSISRDSVERRRRRQADSASKAVAGGRDTSTKARPITAAVGVAKTGRPRPQFDSARVEKPRLAASIADSMRGVREDSLRRAREVQAPVAPTTVVDTSARVAVVPRTPPKLPDAGASPSDVKARADDVLRDGIAHIVRLLKDHDAAALSTALNTSVNPNARQKLLDYLGNPNRRLTYVSSTSHPIVEQNGESSQVLAVVVTYVSNFGSTAERIVTIRLVSHSNGGTWSSAKAEMMSTSLP